MPVLRDRDLRRRKPEPVPELSSKANEMLQKFGHFYFMPIAGTDMSVAASTVALASVVVGVVAGIRGFWWGLAIGVVNYWIAAPFARFFNPSKFLADEEERAAHNEIVTLMRQRSQGG